MTQTLTHSTHYTHYTHYTTRTFWLPPNSVSYIWDPWVAAILPIVTSYKSNQTVKYKQCYILSPQLISHCTRNTHKCTKSIVCDVTLNTQRKLYIHVYTYLYHERHTIIFSQQTFLYMINTLFQICFFMCIMHVMARHKHRKTKN